MINYYISTTEDCRSTGNIIDGTTVVQDLASIVTNGYFACIKGICKPCKHKNDCDTVSHAMLNCAPVDCAYCFYMKSVFR